jgi:hypothetical protein
MANCVFEIRRGESLVLGIHAFDQTSADPWTDLRDKMRSYSSVLMPAVPHGAGEDEVVVTIGVLDFLAVNRRQVSARVA